MPKKLASLLVGGKNMSFNKNGPTFSQELMSLGDKLDKSVLDATREMYLQVHKERQPSDIKIISDQLYGIDPRQCLDVHLPETKEQGLATFIYFHGGGFVGGNKNAAGPHIYGNVGNYFAENNIIGINATYRLAPHATWPSATQDVGLALQWAIENVAEFGGDPNRIFICGQSAGGAHVANYAFRKDMHLPSSPGYRGVILLSGTFAVKPGKVSENALNYYGTNESLYDKMNLFNNIDYFDLPVFIGHSEFDPPSFKANSAELSSKLTQLSGKSPSTVLLKGHNHFSPAFSFRTNDESVSQLILNFCNNH